MDVHVLCDFKLRNWMKNKNCDTSYIFIASFIETYIFVQYKFKYAIQGQM